MAIVSDVIYLTRILTYGQRIELFKEINRMHRKIYGWRMIYDNVFNTSGRIDIDRDARDVSKDWVPMTREEAQKYYFFGSKGSDITLLQGPFAWQAHYFYHANPYRFPGTLHELKEEDYVSDSLGKRIRSDVSHPVKCSETMIVVQQRKDDGRVWVSANWLYHPDCYGVTSPFTEAVYKAIVETSEGDKKISGILKEKYEEICDANRHEFEKILKRYFGGGKLNGKCWDGGYVLAASREWRIKTLEQLNEALEVEEKHFQIVLDEFIDWIKRGGLNLREGPVIFLKKELKELYDVYIRGEAKRFCEQLIQEDKADPSDVYLWWRGEPNSSQCYAFLTLFFELKPDDIGTAEFDEKVSRNLKTIINLAEKVGSPLSSYKEYEPHVWRAIFF